MDAEKIKQGVRLLLEGMGEDPAARACWRPRTG